MPLVEAFVDVLKFDICHEDNSSLLPFLSVMTNVHGMTAQQLALPQKRAVLTAY